MQSKCAYVISNLIIVVQIPNDLASGIPLFRLDVIGGFRLY
jgi:hypothetical protein